ncbi:hypothetical protein [Actinomadura sp. 7K507]|uniref:hypothetical protein n=1 Tax=Actinomadura sp. 7K507 TaxID=2530365 RepID=UPI001404F176|nr:hypothetical protein [Actinomadura sp. 7K507]
MELAWWLPVAAVLGIVLGISFACVAVKRRRGEREARNPNWRAEQQEARRAAALDREVARVEAARREMAERVAARQAEVDRAAERLGGDARKAAEEMSAEIARRAEEAALRAEEGLRQLRRRQDG